MTNITKFTPGPWVAAPFSSVVGAPVVASPSGRSIANVTYFRLGGAFEHHDAESEANAALIAVAPELYSALETLADFLRDAPVDLPELVKADRVLAKARGEI